MIKNITYSVVFPISGITLSGTFQPLDGITAVVGPNESGKTFTSIELTRYLLYGKAALRGVASDYKTLDATGDFIIRDEEYRIERNAKRERFLDAAGTILAVGAEAVTAKAIEKMGYGLAVFDITNASVQKKADIFGKMKPAERKRMIDEVVGLASNEQVERACRDEGKALRREVEAMTRVLVAPSLPKEPEGYRDTKELGREVAEGRALRAKAAELNLKYHEVSAPETPHSSLPRYSQVDIEDLEQHERDRLDQLRTIQQLEAVIAKRPVVSVPYSHMELHAARDRLAVGNTRHLMLKHQVTCPNCATAFIPGSDLPELPAGPDLNLIQIQTYEKELVLEAAARVAEEELDEEVLMTDMSSELQATWQARQAWAIYESNLNIFERQTKTNEDVAAALAALGPVPTQAHIDQLWDTLTKARVYESQLASYETSLKTFNDTTVEIAEKLRLADEFKKGGEALSDARATLKAHLAPALSRVSSALITDMTHGKHTSIIVGEDMEISVDGQRIETLSGGAETVANLALRLAFGQVLVAQTFPVFLGDEMDADTDTLRREAVIEALVSLKKHLKQIILVTHRDVSVADHVIDLGSTV
jgi:exonuclease SbcC